MARISIIIPVYNTEQYLDECLQSVLNQTFADIEIICINDGSQDGSGAILDAYAQRDKRIRVVHQENAGVSATRNKGISMARGNYLLMVDSDDYIAPQTCEKLLAVADATQADIVVFGGTTFPADDYINTLMHPRNTVVHNGIQALFEERGSFPLACNKMYARKLLQKNNISYDESLQLGEDNAFQFAAFPLASCVAFCQDELYFYRFMRQDSALHALWSDQADKVQRHMEVVRSVFTSWESMGILEQGRPQLAAWATNFLFDDIVQLPFDDRCACAKKLEYLYARFAVKPTHLSGEEAARYAYLMHPETAAKGAPKLTIACYAEPGATHVEEGFIRLTNQWQHQLQFLCIDPYDNSEGTAALAEIAAHDRRAQVISASPQDAITQAINAAEAPYILFCSANDEYEMNMADEVLHAFNCNPADVCTFFDFFHALRLEDVGRLLLSFETTGVPESVSTTGTVSPYSGADCPEHVYGYCSLSPRNKAFSCAFLQDCNFNSLDPHSIAHTLDSAKNILSLGHHLVRVCELEEASEKDGTAAAEMFVASFRDLKNSLLEQGIWEQRQRTWANALVLSINEYLDRYTGEAAVAFATYIRANLDELLPSSTYGPEYFFNRYAAEDVEKLRSKDVPAFLDERYSLRLRGMALYYRDLEERVPILDQELYAAVDKARHNEDIEQSFSFKVGWIATAPLRNAKRIILSRCKK